MKLPILISVPHAGLLTPDELKPYTSFPLKWIKKDSDEGADQIYYPLEDKVSGFVTTSYARCFVDPNRAPDNRKSDGVVKTHACWGKKLYTTTPPEAVFERAIDKYYRPYQSKLSALASNSGARLGIDCHTMCEFAPPGAPDPEGSKRPMLCLSDLNGETVPVHWMNRLTFWLRQAFPEFEVRTNSPFRGGYITRFHSQEIPFVQIEISRTAALTNQEKGRRVLEALVNFSTDVFKEDYSALLEEEKTVRKSFFAWLVRLFKRLGF